MAIDLGELLDPTHTVLVLQECQNGIIGTSSALPALASSPMLVPNLARLAAAARAAGVRVIHCTAHHRADGFGANRNARLFRVARDRSIKCPTLLNRCNSRPACVLFCTGSGR